MKFGRYLYTIFFITLAGMAISQPGFSTLGGANYLGMARTGLTLGGVESIYLNQAGISKVNNFGFDLSYERRYNLEDISQISLGAVKTFKDIGTFGIMASSLGFSEYSEQKMAVAYGRSLSSKVSVGGQFDMLRYNIADIGSKNIFSFELGLQLDVNKHFSLGVHLFSPGKIKVAEGTEIASRFRTGIKYAPSDKVFALAEMDKILDRDPQFKFGVGYDPMKVLRVMAGFNITQSEYTFGAFVNIQDKYRITSAVGINDILGNTPALSLQYNN